MWALCDWNKQNLAYAAEKPIAKLRTPHYTEKVELKEPLEFPCKAEYERINVISPQNQDRLRLIQHWWWKFQMLNLYPYNYILNYMAYRCDVR